MNEREARALLTIAGEPGDERIGALVAEHGAVAAVAMVSQGEVRGAIRERLARSIADQALVLALRKLDACGGVFITPEDSAWPAQLNELDVAVPLGLWCRGVGDLNDIARQSLAVVGARAATAYGERIASEVGSLAAECGAAVISGAAYGIDAAAHRGVLAGGGQTIAVLACGVDVAYPSAHRGLLDRIAQNGLIISEAPPGCKPHKRRFLVRNRVIAAVSASTLVVEAALRSGSLSTANWANAIGRPVWGVPGPITSATSAGVHVGIAQGEMNIVADLASVIETVKPEPNEASTQCSAEELVILSALTSQAMTTDELVGHMKQAAASLSAHEVIGALTLLELRGAIVQTATGWMVS